MILSAVFLVVLLLDYLSMKKKYGSIGTVQ